MDVAGSPASAAGYRRRAGQNLARAAAAADKTPRPPTTMVTAQPARASRPLAAGVGQGLRDEPSREREQGHHEQDQQEQDKQVEAQEESEFSVVVARPPVARRRHAATPRWILVKLRPDPWCQRESRCS